MVDQYGSEQYQQLLRLATELDLDGQQIQQLRNIVQYGALDREGELSVQDSAAGDFAGMEAVLDGSQLAISGGRAHTSAHGELQLAGYQYDSVIPDSGVSRWRFEQDVTDSWGDNDGTRNGGSFTSNAAVGNYAYSFSDGDYIDVGVLPLSGSISVSAWVYPTQVSSETLAFSNYGGSGSSENHFVLGFGVGGSNDQPSFFVDNGSSVPDEVTAPSVNADNYYHLIGVYDDAVPEIRIYLDGSLEGTSSWSGTTPDWQERGTQLGAPPSGGDNYIGDMDDPRAFNKALSDSEASNLYNTGSISG